MGEIDFKKYLGYIIPVIILLVIGFFVYDFFIGSIQEVEIQIKNLESEFVNDNSIKITDEQENKIFTGDGEGSYTLNLKRGSYKIDVIAQGYDSASKTITVPVEGGSFSVTLRKRLNVEILGLNNFPEALFAGQELRIPIQFKNNESHEIEIEPTLGGDFEKMSNASFDSQKMIIPAENTSASLLSFTVPASISIRNKSAGDDFKGSIKIKYTSIKEDVASKLFPELQLDITQSQIKLSGDAGDSKETKITVYNKNNFVVKDLVLEVEITVANRNDSSEVLEWLMFTSPPADPDYSYRVEIDEIQKKERVNVSLRIDIPITAKEETISGNIILTAPVLLGQKNIKPFRIEVNEEADVELEVRVSSYEFKPEWDAAIGVVGGYEAVEGYIVFKNRGEVTLKDVLVSVESVDQYLECDEDWVEFVNLTEIEKLEPGDEQRIYISVKAPVGVHETGETMSCRVKYSYRDPLDEAKRIDNSVARPFAINPRN